MGDVERYKLSEGFYRIHAKGSKKMANMASLTSKDNAKKARQKIKMEMEKQYVQIYWNFHKKCFSVQDRSRIVIAHCDRIAVEDVEFFVSEAGRQRVLREKCKNVHAKVRGNRVREFADKNDLKEVVYNPYKYDSFVIKSTLEPIYSADYALLEDGKVYVK